MSDLALLGIPAMCSCGLLLIVLGLTGRRITEASRFRRERTDEWLTQAGVKGVSSLQVAALCGLLAIVCGLVSLALSGSLWIGTAFAALAGYLPLLVLRGRRGRRIRALQDIWPDAIDNLASGVRAGLSLPEAVAGLAERGPEPLRAPLQQFADAYRASGHFSPALDALKAELADPTADRVIEVLRIAREVGGSELGRTLRTLSAFLRDEQRVRKEIEARQSWTLVAARLAYATPWFVLFMLTLRPEAAAAYRGPGGAVVIASGAVIATVGYRLMLAIARVPAEERVLR